METLNFSALENASCPGACQSDWQPLVVEGWLRQWLGQHFSAAANINAPDLQDKIWRPDETTKILIESVGRWRPQLTEKRPGILLRNQGVQALQLGLGNRIMGSGGTDAAREVFQVLVRGTHTLFCIGGEYGECELLGYEVFRTLLRFGIKFVERYGALSRITPPQMGPVGKLEEASEHFAAPVSFSYVYWETWELAPQDTSIARFNDLTISQG